MTNASLQPVAPGQKVQADTINKIIKSTDFGVKTTGALTHIGKDVNIQVLNPGQNDFSGQKFRKPFDLSVSQTATGIQYTVLRPELYLWGSYRTIADNGVKLEFPLSTHSALYISCDAGCSPDKYGLAFMIDDPTEDLHFTDVDHPEEGTGGASLQSIAPLTTKTNGTLKKPLWSQSSRLELREYWANGSTLENPHWSDDHGTLENPQWRNGSTIENPSWGPSNTLTEKWIQDNPDNAAEVLAQPGGATETDITVNNDSDYDTTGEKYASTPHFWLLYKFLPNGTVLEDCRNMAIPAAEDMYFKATRPTKLDLSSLNWKVDYPTDPVLSAKYAQNFHYDAPREEDLVDLKKVKADAQTSTAEISTCVDKWRFLVRPEEGIGEGTLHYASLSDVLSAISSEGGGGCECDLEPVLTSGTKIARWTPDGQNWTDIYCLSSGGGCECSCDLSVTPPATLSSLGQDLVKIAAWTKDSWQTHVDILAPDVAKDIVTMANRMAYTPFYLRIRYNNGSPIMDIINNFFFYGREMKTLQTYSVTQTGTYYLEIETNQYGYYISRIVREASTSIPPAVKQNDDTHTYYPLWVVTSVNPTWDTGFPFDCRPMYITPFYSN